MSQKLSRGKILAVIIGLTLLVAIGTFGLRFWVHQGIHVPLQERAANFAAELKARGAQVGPPRLEENMPGVKETLSLDVDGKTVRLLMFDVSNEAHLKTLRQIRESRSVTLLGVDHPAEDEGDVIIIDFEDHPRKKDILELFHKKK